MCFFTFLGHPNAVVWLPVIFSVMPLILLNVNLLLKEFDRSYYTIPLMVLLNLLFLLVALRYKSAARGVKLLIGYGALSLLADFFDLIITTISLDPKTIQLLSDYKILCFIQIEFIIFYVFFYLQFPNKKVQKKIAVTGKIFALITLLTGLYAAIAPLPLPLKRLSGYISVTESILILIPSFYYFYFLFLEPPVKNLVQEPSFWITTGIAFLHSLNLSNFLIDNYLSFVFDSVWPGIYSLNYIAYCFLFILFIISLLCSSSAYFTTPLHSRQVNIKSSSDVF